MSVWRRILRRRRKRAGGAWPPLYVATFDLGNTLEVRLVVGKPRLGQGWDAPHLYSKRFPRRNLDALEGYRWDLTEVARHAAAGTFGWFVEHAARTDGTVDVILYDRWFDGVTELHCEKRAERRFDVDELDVVVACAEFTEELRERARRANEERCAALLASAEESDEQARVAGERARSADELARILREVRDDA